MGMEALVKVTLPAVAAQPVGITIGQRSVTVSGSLADGSVTRDPADASPIAVKVFWDPATRVSVSVAEVPAVGKASPVCSTTFSPQDHHQAVAADPSQFGIEVVPGSIQAAP